MLKGIWLSYDLGVDGDYEGLYYWLDNNSSKECGDSVAFFKYKYKSDILIELAKDIKNQVKLRKKDRIYVIYLDGKSHKGRFIFGNRKRAPWEGYAAIGEEITDES